MLLQKIFRPHCELHAESFLSCLLREEGCSYSIETEIRVCQMPFYCASTVSFTAFFSWFALLDWNRLHAYSWQAPISLEKVWSRCLYELKTKKNWVYQTTAVEIRKDSYWAVMLAGIWMIDREERRWSLIGWEYYREGFSKIFFYIETKCKSWGFVLSLQFDYEISELTWEYDMFNFKD